MQQNNGYIGLLSTEVQTNIIEEMALPELMDFANTRKENRDGIGHYIAMRWTKLLWCFVSDADAFINLMDRTGTVLSGSCAVSLIQAERGAIVPRDMDVYTTVKFETEVVDHFKSKEGYECMKEIERKTEYDSSAILKIHKLEKGEKQVDIIVTHWKCALAPILQFHSTAVMNYVTAWSIVCLYPRWTTTNQSFINPHMYLENLTHLRTLHVLMKYRRRGFTVSADPFHLGEHVCETRGRSKKKSGYCPHSMRSTVDNDVLIWDFGPTQMLGKTTITCRDMPIMVWCLGGHKCMEGDKNEMIVYMIVSA
ncbi:hypothetical protein F4604DRAFT_1679204 [Suillus subluteus]|nr:hypothetical protein F4604DRAFT_1679204 [Suillus subluteus]